MSILRLRAVDPFNVTLAANANESHMTLYHFLKSLPSSQDRQSAYRDFMSSAAGTSSPAVNAYRAGHRSNAVLVNKMEDAVFRRFILGDHDPLSVSKLDGGEQWGETNVRLAVDKPRWRSWLRPSDAVSGTRNNNIGRDGGASSPTAARVENHPHDVVRVRPASAPAPTAAAAAVTIPNKPSPSSSPPMSRRPPGLYEEDEAENDDELDTPAPSGRGYSAPQLQSPPSAGRGRQPSSSSLANATASSPPSLQTDTPARNALTAQGEAAVLSKLASIVCNPNNQLPRSESESRHRSQQTALENRLLSLSTQIQALKQQQQGRGSGSSEVGVLESRLSNLQELSRALDHEQDTLNVTASALRLEIGGMTFLLRSVLSAMMRAEGLLAGNRSTEQTTEQMAESRTLLAHLQAILDERVEE